jgi:hypothetical protein
VLLLAHPGELLGSTVDSWATVGVAIRTIGTVVYRDRLEDDNGPMPTQVSE